MRSLCLACPDGKSLAIVLVITIPSRCSPKWFRWYFLNKTAPWAATFGLGGPADVSCAEAPYRNRFTDLSCCAWYASR